MTTSITISAPSTRLRRFEGFPVGYYEDLHPDAGLNYAMNRFMTGELDMIEALRAVAPRIHDIRDYARELHALGEQALERGEKLNAAHYLRAAEFMMFGDDPRREPARRRAIQLLREHFGFADEHHFQIPYENGFLSAYRLTPPAPSRGTIVFFGGFDSYIEDWFPMQCYFAGAGYDFVSFEGPGQGTSLEEGGLHLTHEWHKPVGAVLDYFKLNDVTLIGLSLGGCLAVRAAAFEPRVQRVVLDDICSDYFEVMQGLMTPTVRTALTSLLKVGADHLLDAMVEHAAKASISTDWDVQQGMHVSGSKTPSEYMRKMQRYRTDDVSPLVQQDVLVLGGSEDICIPLHQFHDQIRMLTNARSLTARLFTKHEQGHQHCQIGNLGLQFRVIRSWLETLQERDEAIG